MHAASGRKLSGRSYLLGASLLCALALALFPLTLLTDGTRAALAVLLAFAPAAWLALRGDPSAQARDSGLFAPHERIDAAIDDNLGLVISDTETSAMAIMQQLRGLHDSADALVAMLVDSRARVERLDAEIADGLAALAGMRELIASLPAKLSANFEQVRDVAEQIRKLSGLAELVQSISIQSHLLAINAAIEAHRAGEQGRTFRVVADEVKNLAANSGRAAAEIGDRLSSTWMAVDAGMQASVDDALGQLDDIRLAAESIRELEKKHLDFSAYHREQFSAITSHNEALANDIVDVLGRAQYQDVVRQSVERIRDVVKRRNAILGAAMAAPGDSAQAGEAVDALASLHTEYRSHERVHSNSDRAASGVTPTGEPTIELF